jgi:putative copper export protein
MSNRIRQLAAALAACGLLLALASPAAAQSSMLTNADRESSVPMVFDALVLRPVGLAMTVVGTAIFVVPVAPVMAVTRPTDMGKPFQHLVVAPARYTFVDPLGLHPPHD